jgi:hypothetical protein
MLNDWIYFNRGEDSWCLTAFFDQSALGITGTEKNVFVSFEKWHYDWINVMIVEA